MGDQDKTLVPRARLTEDEPLREEDVTRGDLLDDRVQEGDGLGRVEDGEEFPPVRRD